MTWIWLFWCLPLRHSTVLFLSQIFFLACSCQLWWQRYHLPIDLPVAKNTLLIISVSDTLECQSNPLMFSMWNLYQYYTVIRIENRSRFAFANLICLKFPNHLGEHCWIYNVLLVTFQAFWRQSTWITYLQTYCTPKIEHGTWALGVNVFSFVQIALVLIPLFHFSKV